jgi:site-specific recombinase XerD
VYSNDFEKQRVKKQCYNSVEINGLLDEIENTLSGILRKAIFDKQNLNIEEVKKRFDNEMGNVTKHDFFSLFAEFINKSGSTKKHRTIQAYETTRSKLKAFQEKSKVIIEFENINIQFYNRFIDFLLVEGLLNNSVGKHIKTLKTFINFCKNNDLISKNISLKGFKVFNEDVDIVHLTNEELIRVYELQNLPKHLSQIRDVFCFACFTGLRFSDIDKLTHSHIKADFVEMRAEKTRDFIRVPVNSYSRSILYRYRNDEKPLPTGLSNQKTNDYLKEIAKLASIDDIVHLEKFSGSKKIEICKAKHDLISSHAARRTFVTLALEKGIRAEIVMAMTGHKSYRTFKKYIKVTDNIMKVEMNRLWNENKLVAV